MIQRAFQTAFATLRVARDVRENKDFERPRSKRGPRLG